MSVAAAVAPRSRATGVTALAWGVATAPIAAAVTEPGPIAAPGWSSVLQMFLGLGVVLGLIVVIAWFARRFGAAGRPGGLLRVVGGVMVGPRERVVVVEMQDTWLVLGVTPQQVNTLHTLSRPVGAAVAPASLPADRNFSRWLQKAIKGQGT
ncbi:MAG: flagellar biosynthetic protein FliO [Burkholderiales bacterium]|jgi:flagellar protein FliO/FliZ|nr:flagellar biosynthetic protein FliO [Burkholderiales bacterium]